MYFFFFYYDHALVSPKLSHVKIHCELPLPLPLCFYGICEGWELLHIYFHESKTLVQFTL